MQISKFVHSCVRLDDGDRRLAIDPGVFSDVEPALDGVDAVLITHEHQDHVDPVRLRAAVQLNSALRVWAPQSVVDAFVDLGDQMIAVAPGETFTAGGFAVEACGGQHAIIHPSIPVVANVGYLIEGVFHPGDSLTVPIGRVEHLLAPITAPWSKVSEVIDFVVSVRAPKVSGIHDSTTTPAGLGIIEGHVARIGGQYGSDYVRL